MIHKFYKTINIVLAFIFLIIGAIGIVLPLLPTTPFLLLASFFFARGSKRFHHWFVSTKLYKDYIQEFVVTKSMTLKTKICILIPASVLMLLAFYLVSIWHARVVIMVVMIFKYYYFFFRIQTIQSEMSK